jgi:hypothetical protein
MWRFREAFRNVVTGTTRAVLWASIWALAIGGLCLAEVWGVGIIYRQAAEYVQSGAAVSVLDTTSLVDGRACEGLVQVAGVERSGALSRMDEPVLPGVLPAGPVAAFRVTEGALQMFSRLVDLGGEGVVISIDVAQSLGAEPGETLPLVSGSVRIRGVFEWPDDGRLRGFTYSALVPSPEEGVFDQCWMYAWPQVAHSDVVLSGTLIPHGPQDSASVQFGQVNTTQGKRFDGAERFRARLGTWAWLASLTVASGIGFVAARVRRLELASARHAGVSRMSQLIQMAAETAWWQFLALTLAGPLVALCVGVSPGDDSALLIRLAFRVLGAGVIGTALGAVIAVWSIREKRLFRYFKIR